MRVANLSGSGDRQYGELVEFARSLSPQFDDDAFIPFMAVTLFGDESESQNPSVFTLAGFIASTVTGWKDFIPAWREMLCNVGPYPVEALHTNLIEKARPPFDGWTPSEREALIARAVDILADTRVTANMYSIGCTFMVDDLNAQIPGIVGSTTAEIYERCYRVLFHNILKFSPFRGIDFVFDVKKKAEGRVKAHFDEAKKKLDRDPSTAGMLNDCNFREDRLFIPLQAADLLAFELRRRAWDRAKNPDAPLRPTYQKLKSVFKRTTEDAKPPYRQRLFRCYDARFLANLQSVLAMSEHQPITEGDVMYLWYHMDTAED